MKNTSAHQLVMIVVLAAAFTGSANAQISKQIAIGASQVCSEIMDLISPRDKTTCNCDGSFSVDDGLEVDVACQSAKSVCIGPGDVFCGTPNVNATVSPRGVEDSKACLSFEKDPLNAIDIPDLCVSAEGSGFGRGSTATFDSCAVTIGTTDCECEVCESGRDFTFDCSAISIPTPTVLLPSLPGPKSDKCIGLGLLPDIGGEGFSPFSRDEEDEANATVANATRY